MRPRRLPLRRREATEQQHLTCASNGQGLPTLRPRGHRPSRQAVPGSSAAPWLKLSAELDGFGFFYGWAERDGERVRVNVLPPKHLWRGDIELETQKPDARAWILYLDGEEFARVERRED
jgi:hypothetical protein